jgi:succinate dehydrogenase / fumarate reductase, cytochrome b subunit
MSSPGTSRRLLNTSVAKKFFSALTGILLCLYLVAHLIGNLLLLWEPRIFNAYAAFLTGLPILPLIELALLGLFLAHIYAGVRVYRENKAARPQGYAHSKWSREQNEEAHGPRSRKSLSSTTMIFSGIFVLGWTVFHVLQMKYGLFDTTNVGHDLAYRVELAFKNPLVVIVYIVALLLLGMHLNHGVSSAVQSMGVSGYGKFWLWLGRAYTIVIIGGFILIPLVKFFGPEKGPTENSAATTAVSTHDAH